MEDQLQNNVTDGTTRQEKYEIYNTRASELQTAQPLPSVTTRSGLRRKMKSNRNTTPDEFSEILKEMTAKVYEVKKKMEDICKEKLFKKNQEINELKEKLEHTEIELADQKKENIKLAEMNMALEERFTKVFLIKA